MPVATATKTEQELLQDRGLTSREMTLRVSSIDEEDRTVEAVMTTEEPTTVFDWSRYGPIEEVLLMSGARYPSQVPLLHAHSRYTLDDILGSTRDIRVDGSKMRGRLHFADDQDVERHWQKIVQGHVTDVSIGYRVEESSEVPAGETKTIKGREYRAKKRPLRVTTKWTLRELSVVPIGADPKAKLREESGLTAPTRKEADMPATKKKKKDEDAVAPDVDDDDEGARDEPEPEEEPKRNPKPKKKPDGAGTAPGGGRLEPPKDLPGETVEEITKKTLAAERKRMKDIRSLAGDDVSPKVVQRAIDEGWDLAKASAEFLDDLRKNRPPPPSPRVSGERADDFVRIAEIAVVEGNGYRMPEIEDKERREARKYHGIGLQETARLLLRNMGKEVPHSPMELLRVAISTGTYTELLGNAATKSLKGAYDEYPSTLRQWAGTRTVADFKQYKEITLSEFGSVAKVGKAGELAHGAVSEFYETYQADTYGKQWSLDRQSWINDDMGAFMRIPAMLGRAAARNVDDIGYALLISAAGLGPTMTEDSQVLFYSSRTTPNYITGATYVLSDAGFTKLFELMAKIAGPAGETLNIQPAVCLVPVVLRTTAMKWLGSALISYASSTITPEKNIWSGFDLKLVSDPRLDAATNGTTAWYLVANPADAASIVIVRLAGTTGPVVERHDPENVLGIGWRMYDDVGVAAVDWRGIVRAKGA